MQKGNILKKNIFAVKKSTYRKFLHFIGFILNGVQPNRYIYKGILKNTVQGKLISILQAILRGELCFLQNVYKMKQRFQNCKILLY